MSLRLCEDTIIPVYKNGRWTWNSSTETFEFVQNVGKEGLPDYAIPAPQIKYGYQFKDHMDQVEEIIFIKKFKRPNISNDADVITIQDIKDVAFFTASSKAMSKRFIHYFHTEIIDEFLNALIIYFEYFLKVVEFLLIRRDEVNGENGKIRNMETVHIEQMLAEYLLQYRLVLAREYAKLSLGEKEAHQFHHMANKMKKSTTERDRTEFEIFINFCTRVTWIAMHRRAYNIIDCEINRLFRSGHFNVAEKQLFNVLKYTPREEQVLYGPNDLRCNYRSQLSPLLLDLKRITPKNADVLWIGNQKYRGTNPRLFELELEYITADAQLNFIDVQHGILGNPKDLYNTMLTLDWHALRKEKFTDTYDPYKLVRKPYLEIPEWDEFNTHHERNQPYFKIISLRYEKNIVEGQRRKWKYRGKVIKSVGQVKLADYNILRMCENELELSNTEFKIDTEKIIADFLEEKERKLKKKGT